MLPAPANVKSFGVKITPAGSGYQGRKQCPDAVKAQAVALKRENPGWGIRRISQTLRRWFHLGVSAETVRETLHEQG